MKSTTACTFVSYVTSNIFIALNDEIIYINWFFSKERNFFKRFLNGILMRRSFSKACEYWIIPVFIIRLIVFIQNQIVVIHIWSCSISSYDIFICKRAKKTKKNQMIVFCIRFLVIARKKSRHNEKFSCHFSVFFKFDNLLNCSLNVNIYLYFSMSISCSCKKILWSLWHLSLTI